MSHRSARLIIALLLVPAIVGCGDSEKPKASDAKPVSKDKPAAIGEKTPAVVEAEPELESRFGDRPEGPWYFRGDSGTTDEDLAKLPPSVSDMRFDGSVSVTDAGLAHLARQTFLDELKLENMDLSDASVAIISKLAKLKKLHISGKKITNEGLAPLAKLTRLEELTIECPGITDEGLAAVSNLKRLTDLTVREAKLTLAAYDRLKDLPVLEDVSLSMEVEEDDLYVEKISQVRNYRFLRLNGAGITDASAPHLAKMTGLEGLVLNQVNMTDTGLSQLTSLTALGDLQLDGCIHLTDKGLAPLGKLPSLLSLSVRSCPWIIGPGLASFRQVQKLDFFPVEDANIAHLANLDQLTGLTLSDYSDDGGHSAISTAGLAHLAKMKNLHWLSLNRSNIDTLEPLAHMTELESLHVRHTAIKDAGIKPLAGFKSLRNLSLSGTNVRDFTPLQGLRELDTLWIEGTPINDESIAPLLKLRSLTSLHLHNTDVTERGAARLRRALPSLDVRMQDFWAGKPTKFETTDVELTDDKLATLPPETQVVSLYRTKNITSVGLAHLKKLPLLRELSLREIGLNDDAMKVVGELAGLEDIYLDEPMVTDAGIAHLSGLKQLARLRVNDEKLTKACLPAVAALTELRELELRSVLYSPDDQMMELLSRLVHLRKLHFSGVKLTNAAADSLAKMKGLEQLDMHSVKFDDAAFAKLTALTSLYKIELGLCENVTDKGLAALGSLPELEELRASFIDDKIRGSYLASFPNLRKLEFSATTDVALSHLAKLTSLVDLSLSASENSTAQGMMQLQSLTNLRKLRLSGSAITSLAPFAKAVKLSDINAWSSTKIDDAGLAPVAALVNLKEFSSIANPISDLTPFSNMKHLRRLTVSSSNVEDDDLPALYGVVTLESISLSYSKVTAAGASKLKQALPNAWSVDYGK